MKTYFVQIRFDGETISKMMTERELAHHWEENDIAGIGCEYAAFDVSEFGKAKPINVYDTVQEVLGQIRWEQQEFRDYCEAVNEYGYGFEGMYLEEEN